MYGVPIITNTIPVCINIIDLILASIRFNYNYVYMYSLIIKENSGNIVEGHESERRAGCVINNVTHLASTGASGLTITNPPLSTCYQERISYLSLAITPK